MTGFMTAADKSKQAPAVGAAAFFVRRSVRFVRSLACAMTTNCLREKLIESVGELIECSDVTCRIGNQICRIGNQICRIIAIILVRCRETAH